MLVRSKVNTRQGGEQPGEHKAGQEQSPGGGPAVAVELLREIVEGGLQHEAAHRAEAWPRHQVGGHSRPQAVPPHHDGPAGLELGPQPGQHHLRVPDDSLHTDHAGGQRVPVASEVKADHIEAQVLQAPIELSPVVGAPVRSLAVDVEDYRLSVTEQSPTLAGGGGGGNGPDSNTTTGTSHLHVVILPS